MWLIESRRQTTRRTAKLFLIQKSSLHAVFIPGQCDLVVLKSGNVFASSCFSVEKNRTKLYCFAYRLSFGILSVKSSLYPSLTKIFLPRHRPKVNIVQFVLFLFACYDALISFDIFFLLDINTNIDYRFLTKATAVTATQTISIEKI